MQEVVPSVVAKAVSIVMASCSIFCQSSLFMVGVVSYELWVMLSVVSPFEGGQGDVNSA